MAITSASTLDEVLAQYNDNLSWDGDAIKAVLALEAIRWLLVNRAASFSQAGRSINYSALEQEKSRLEDYVSDFGNAVSSKRVTFTRGRCLT